MNNNFQNYVTSQAFVLVLSRPQIESLYWVAYQSTKARLTYGPHLTSVYALQRKGLVVRESHRFNNPWQLTEEGRLALELCKRAGLLINDAKRKAAA